MTKFSILSLVLLAISLSSCGASIPNPPHTVDYQFNGEPRAFYGVDSESGERSKVEINDPKMKAAQCLTANDYQATQDWVRLLIKLLEDNSKNMDAKQQKAFEKLKAELLKRQK